MTTLAVFSEQGEQKAKLLLAGKVAAMMGRKWEEGDWSEVYCAAMDIPDAGWSNLNIDVNHGGLGVEFKMLRVPRLGEEAIEKICGTTMMHPSLTRSIRIDNLYMDPNDVMKDVFGQYRDLIDSRTSAVTEAAGGGSADMHVGWLLWENKLREFLYWEERMVAPDAQEYYAQWHVRAAMGQRKSSKSLWIFDRRTSVVSREFWRFRVRHARQCKAWSAGNIGHIRKGHNAAVACMAISRRARPTGPVAALRPLEMEPTIPGGDAPCHRPRGTR